MFEILPHQVSALEEKRWAAFESRLQVHILSEHGDAVTGLSESTLQRQLSLGLRYARSLGLHFESTLAVCVAIMFEVGPLFARQADIARLMVHPDFDPDTGLEVAIELAPDAAWEEVENTATSDDWQVLEAELDAKDQKPGGG